MTGFGDAAAEHEGLRYTVEIRSVNNRFLKTILRLPDRLAALEPWLESIIRDRLHRGTVTLTIGLSEQASSAAYELNGAILQSYVEQIAKASGREPGAIDPSGLLHLPGVLNPPAGEEQLASRSRAALEPLLGQALDHLESMRSREGHGLREDLLSHLDRIEAHVLQIREMAPRVAVSYETRLRERLTRLLDELSARQAEPADIVREVAVYAEKTDVAEEIARLVEHIAHFRELLVSEDPRPIGRTLDFLAQELLHEANTIASKTPNTEIRRLIVDVTRWIDRIKEQAQNAE